MSFQELALQTAQSLGFDLIETERSAGGVLRVTIDWPWQAGQTERFVQVEDCEKVTRQLQYALEVEGVEYRRLEVSSPGIDRPLRGEADFQRFTGQIIDLTLKAPMGSAAQGLVSAQRKKFRGLLQAGDGEGQWQISWRDEPATKPGARVSRKKEPAPLQVLGFRLDELREARLAPIVDFKGRRTATPNLE
ncbi:MAG: ribosome maturation factor RimP [Alphaproteobacteria bacterium]|nr:ribosome maturation factor RimP [Alphaproteobacteria bacterium]